MGIFFENMKLIHVENIICFSVLNGKVMRKVRVEVTGIGALLLRHFLKELCKNTRACEVAGEGWLTLSKERFQTGEILFQPHLAQV